MTTLGSVKISRGHQLRSNWVPGETPKSKSRGILINYMVLNKLIKTHFPTHRKALWGMRRINIKELFYFWGHEKSICGSTDFHEYLSFCNYSLGRTKEGDQMNRSQISFQSGQPKNKDEMKELVREWLTSCTMGSSFTYFPPPYTLLMILKQILELCITHKYTV